MNGFSEIRPLKNNLYWSSEIDSWDERNDILYTTVTVYTKKGEKFKVKETFSISMHHGGNVVKADESTLQKLKKHALNSL